jgi:hypothetical protein
MKIWKSNTVPGREFVKTHRHNKTTKNKHITEYIPSINTFSVSYEMNKTVLKSVQ